MSFTSMLNGARNPYALSLSDIAVHLKDKCSWYCIQISRLESAGIIALIWGAGFECIKV